MWRIGIVKPSALKSHLHAPKPPRRTPVAPPIMAPIMKPILSFWKQVGPWPPPTTWYPAGTGIAN